MSDYFTMAAIVRQNERRKRLAFIAAAILVTAIALLAGRAFA
jgi:hypothetical protein